MKNSIINTIIKGKVTGIKDYGIFFTFDNGYTGLVHISEISDKFVNDINQYVTIGQYYYVKVINLDEINKKYVLSIKNINYKYDYDQKIKESKQGFSLLKSQLNVWIEEKMNELSKNNNN